MSREPNSVGDVPRIAATAFVHPTATLVGHVIVEGRVFIGPHAVLRADELGEDGRVAAIVVREESNVQDGVVVHALGGTGVEIGPRASVAHSAVVHGPCRIGAGCFVGFGSVVYRATLDEGVVVMHHAVVEGAAIPPGLLVPSMTAVRGEEDVRRLERTSLDAVAFAREVVRTNIGLAEAGLRGGAGK